jgi:nitroreductase
LPITRRNIAAKAGDVPCMTPRDLTPDELLSTTRAVRKRLDLARPVERELIEDCLDLAFQAPTGGNLQGWHFVLVTEPGRKKALADLYRTSKRENDPLSVPPEHQRIMDASAYLADHLHEVPVLVVPCIEGRTENTPFLQQAVTWAQYCPPHGALCSRPERAALAQPGPASTSPMSGKQPPYSGSHTRRSCRSR